MNKVTVRRNWRNGEMEKWKCMKRNDIILAGAVLVIAVFIIIYMNAIKKNGDTVVVKINGEVYKELPLVEDTTLEIKGVNEGVNILVVEDGYADIIEASCPDKLCVRQKRIHFDGESLVCLPNKVVIEIKSDTESGIDAISK